MSEAAATPENHGTGVRYLVQTMDQLRAPDGCPWDIAQTHQTLVRHLLEEAFEAADAIEHGNRDELREELGDVLLQVVFHAAIAASEPDPFTLDDIAREVADKLVRRHPYVFGQAKPDQPLSAEESHRRWDQMKAAEKARGSVLDGIPLAQPALARAQKVVARAERGGIALRPVGDGADASAGGDGVPALAGGDGVPAPKPLVGRNGVEPRAERAQPPAEPGPTEGRAEHPGAQPPPSPSIGAQLLDLVRAAQAAGLDAESELRLATRQLEMDIRTLESQGKETGCE